MGVVRRSTTESSSLVTTDILSCVTTTVICCAANVPELMPNAFASVPRFMVTLYVSKS